MSYIVRQATPNQKRFVLAELASSGSYLIPTAYIIRGHLDPEKFREALEKVLALHDAARTDFIVDHGVLKARIHDDPQYTFEIGDIESSAIASIRKAFLPFAVANVDVTDCASLVRVFLARVTTDEWVFCSAIHHSLMDGISRTHFFQDLINAYEGNSIQPAESYYDFFLDADDITIAEERNFWEKWGRSGTTKCHFPPLFLANGSEGQGITLTRSLERSGDELRRFGRSIGSTKFGVLAATYTIAVGRLLDSEEPVVSFQSAGRRTFGADNSVIGSFSNTLPLRLRLTGKEPFHKLAKTASLQTRLAVSHEHISLDEIHKLADFDTSFAINANPTEKAITSSSLSVSPRLYLDRRTEYAFNLLWTDREGEMDAHLFLNSALYPKDIGKKFLEQQTEIIQAAMEDPLKDVSSLFRSTRKRSATRAVKNYAPLGYRSIIDRFIAHACSQPESIALIWGARKFTYADVLQEARVYCEALMRAGARPGDRVAVFASRHPALISAMIGATLCSLRFAVFDSKYPEQRLRKQRAILEPPFAICAGTDFPGWARQEPSMTCVQLASENLRAIEARPPTYTSPAYFLFTSGTTGNPKCLGHPSEALLYYVSWEIEKYKVSSFDKVALLSGLSHDPIMRDIFVALSAGASIVIPEEQDFQDPRALRHCLKDNEVTIAHITPSLGALLSLSAECDELPNLRLVVWGGGVLSGKDIEEFSLIAKNAAHLNLYGATETPQAALTYDVSPANQWSRIPIGIAPPWIETKIIGEDGQECGVGETGEIVFSFPYHVTEVHSDHSSTNFSIHATGDRAQILPDGNAVFLGRKDDQINIRGFRIELQEIEAALESIPGITSAVCKVEDSASDGTPVHAYVVSYLNGTAFDIRYVRRQLEHILPPYMLPISLTKLDRLPLSPNGKIDRAALPPPSLEQKVRSNTVPPRNSIEAAIADVWKKVLKEDRIGVFDDFFEVGGDSLSGTLLILEVEKLFGVWLSPESVFGNASTVSGMAKEIRSLLGPSPAKKNSPSLSAVGAQDKSIDIPFLDFEDIEEVKNKKDRYYVDPKTGLRRFIPRVLYKNIVVNSHGFRGPEITMPKPENTIRLAFLGPSTVLDPMVSSNEATWPHLTCQLLKEHLGVDVDYINSGMRGYNTRQLPIVFEEYVKSLQPDITIICGMDLTADATYLARNKGFARAKQNLVTRITGRFRKWNFVEKDGLVYYRGLHFQPSRLASRFPFVMRIERNATFLSRMILARTDNGKLTFNPNELTQEFSNRLRKTVVSCQSECRLVILLKSTKRWRRDQPVLKKTFAAATNLFHLPFMSLESMLSARDAYDEAVEHIGAETGALVIDGKDAVPGEKKYFADSSHFTDLGSSTMATYLCRTLVNSNIVQSIVDGRKVVADQNTDDHA